MLKKYVRIWWNLFVWRNVFCICNCFWLLKII